MSIRKQYLKTKPVCKVTFRIPEKTGKTAETAYIVGEFNDWDLVATPMKKLKKGAFTVTLNLAKEREYQFRYLLDSEIWQNESDADRFVSSPFEDSENSVISL